MMLRVGRRGAYLLLKAVMFAGHGLAYLLVTPTEAVQRALRIPLYVMPLKAWGVVWLAAAAVAVWSAFQRDMRRDQWGFHALWIVAGFWSASYATAAITGNRDAFARGIIAALLYASFAGVILIVSGWPECKCQRDHATAGG